MRHNPNSNASTFCMKTSASTDDQLSRPFGMGYWSPGVTRSAEVTGALAAVATAARAATKSTASMRFDLRSEDTLKLSRFKVASNLYFKMKT